MSEHATRGGEGDDERIAALLGSATAEPEDVERRWAVVRALLARGDREAAWPWVLAGVARGADGFLELLARLDPHALDGDQLTELDARTPLAGLRARLARVERPGSNGVARVRPEESAAIEAVLGRIEAARDALSLAVVVESALVAFARSLEDVGTRIEALTRDASRFAPDASAPNVTLLRELVALRGLVSSGLVAALAESVERGDDEPVALADRMLASPSPSETLRRVAPELWARFGERLEAIPPASSAWPKLSWGSAVVFVGLARVAFHLLTRAVPEPPPSRIELHFTTISEAERVLCAAGPSAECETATAVRALVDEPDDPALCELAHERESLLQQLAQSGEGERATAAATVLFRLLGVCPESDEP